MRNKYLNPRRADLHYFTREQTRSMAMYEPIGNPYGYGQYNDPVSAALSISAMAGAYTTAATVGWTLASGMVFAGGAISLAGNVTGNKSLQTIGAGIALVGGIGGALDIGSFNETFNGEVMGMEFEGGKLVKQGVNQSVSQGNIAGQNLQAVKDGGQIITGEVNVPMAGDPGTVNLAAGDGYTGGLGGNNLNTSFVTEGIPNYNPALENARFGTPVTGLSGSAPAASIGNIPAPTNQAGGFVNFINRNPGVALVGASSLGPAVGAIADYATGASDAQMEALKADTRYKNAMAALRQEELLKEQERIAALNDPNRYRRGIVNSAVADANYDAYLRRRGPVQT